MPACLYRETVTISKPLTLAARPGAEIRGSDVWTGWSSSGGRWVSQNAVPALSTGSLTACPTGGRCAWPQQVFYDGRPLIQTASNPGAGQFSVDSSQRVTIADNPFGHTVEVTTRAQWVRVTADDVTIRGFRMTHAGPGTQTGAIQNVGADISRGFDRLTLEDNDLSDSHGAVVVVRGSPSNRADGARLVRNRISRGGQLGVFLYNTSNTVLDGNRVTDNNTEGFDSGWEAGGVKAVTVSGLRATNNEFDNNRGTGIWSDVNSTQVEYTGNRVHHNDGAGLYVEVSRGARISRNFAWQNGWTFPPWGWGAGILVAASSDVEVDQNTVAWNADGISVISQNRGTDHNVTNVWVHDNTIAARHQADRRYDNFALAWLQDWNGVLFSFGSYNRGNGNTYWYDAPEGTNHRFSWDGGRRTLAEFNQTPGEEGGRYLSNGEKDQRLAAAGIPTMP